MKPQAEDFKKVKSRNKMPHLSRLDNPEAIKKMSDFAARGHTEEEKKQLDEQMDKMMKKVEEYEVLYQANKKENQELLAVNEADKKSIELLLENIRKLQEENNYHQREELSLGKKLMDQCTLNKVLKETNDDLQSTIDLQQKYCDALRLLSMSEDKPVWNKEVALEVAKNYNGYYEQMVLAYDKDVSEAVALTWQVNDKTLDAVEAIDKIHKLFVKNEGISSISDRDFKKMIYHQYALSKPKLKKEMKKELDRMEFQLEELLKSTKTPDPKMQKHMQDIHELQEAFSNIDNYKEEGEVKKLTHQIKKL